MKKIVYPKLTPFIDLGFIRIGGPGLANSMLIAARAYILAQKNNFTYISPTWCKISFGPYLRNETDKRHYLGLFKKHGVYGIRKIYYLFIYMFNNKKIITVSDLGNYFQELKNNREIAINYFSGIINRKTSDVKKTIGVHIRLGDYKGTSTETEIDYYLKVINTIKNIYGDKYKFSIFSDAKDNELTHILKDSSTKKVFFGDALADMIALSKCNLIIGSDSTFSAMAAFLGNTPIIFPKRHFGEVFNNPNNELVLTNPDNKLALELFLATIFK